MAQGFSVRIYGKINQDPPYVPDAAGNLDALQAAYDSDQAQVANISASIVNVWPISNPGAVVNGVSCYSVIEVPPSGLNVHGDKFIAQQTVAQLATLRNA